MSYASALKSERKLMHCWIRYSVSREILCRKKCRIWLNVLRGSPDDSIRSAKALILSISLSVSSVWPERNQEFK